MSGLSPEVLISGAGPVGLFAALALAKRGIRVQIADTGSWPCNHSYGLALHPQSLDLFEELGLRERILASSRPVRKMALFHSATKRAEVALSSTKPLAVIRQDFLENLLEGQLRDLGVDVLWRHEVCSLKPESGHVTARVDRFERASNGYTTAPIDRRLAESKTIETLFVVGADGQNSLVRRALSVDFPEVAPAQYYMVFEFKTDADLGDEMRIVLGDDTIDVLWPLPAGFGRWSFQVPGYLELDAGPMAVLPRMEGFQHLAAERTKERLTTSTDRWPEVLEEKTLRALIADRAPWFAGSIEGFTWRTAVCFERRLSPIFGRGRLWLAGDAAHLTGPIGVQSMNVGLFEARDLAVTLRRILRDGGSVDELESYHDRWMTTWRELHALQGGLQPEGDVDQWVRVHAKALTACLPAHGEEFSRMAGQLGLRF
jgi:2-polyprenyl-6-methoxyphenol hydroxylase-like FAD-dependent oxidoreductase